MGVSKLVGLVAAVLPLAANAAPAAAPEALRPETLQAMKRDLGLDAEQASARVTRELSAVDVIEHLRTTAGASFAGAWLAENGATVNVGVTDEAIAAEVTAAGATPAIVPNTLDRLQQAKAALDALVVASPGSTVKRAVDPAGVAAWFVDVASNKVVLEAVPTGVAAARDMASQAGLTDAEHVIVTVSEMPTTKFTVQGGLPYIISNAARCSVGFSVNGGYVSAGHCGKAGAKVTTSAGASLGTFSGSVFPGSSDFSYIKTVSGTTLSGTISRSGSTAVAVAGSTAAAAGASVCRSGSTSGVHCGTIQAFSATVNYGSEGTVTGLTRTTVCAEPGDSGGPYYSGSQAQGVTSGGSGDCTVGGTTYFQPVNEILSTYGLTLVKG